MWAYLIGFKFYLEAQLKFQIIRPTKFSRLPGHETLIQKTQKPVSSVTLRGEGSEMGQRGEHIEFLCLIFVLFMGF